MSSKWDKVEKKRVEMMDKYRKVKKALKECEGKLSTKERMTIAAQEEVVTLRRELEASHRESRLLSAEKQGLHQQLVKLLPRMKGWPLLSVRHQK